MDSSAALVEVTADPLGLERYTSAVEDPGAGAVATFSGVTRDNFEGKRVIQLEYEAYVPMAEKQLKVSRDKGSVVSVRLMVSSLGLCSCLALCLGCMFGKLAGSVRYDSPATLLPVFNMFGGYISDSWNPMQPTGC